MAGVGRHNADALFVLARARGLSVEEAATEAGISLRTAYRRMADQDIQLRIAETQREALRQAVGVLANGMVEAARVLRELTAHGPPAVRLGAARALLGQYTKFSDQETLEERLGALERTLSDVQKELKEEH